MRLWIFMTYFYGAKELVNEFTRVLKSDGELLREEGKTKIYYQPSKRKV